jgi:hypothetical protein
MGKFDGKRITGLVGPLVFKKGTKNGDIIQTKAAKVKQTQGTKIAGKSFGQGSTLAGVIRHDLRQITLENYDGDMVNNFASPVRDVLEQCFNKETGQYSFEENSFARLSGFEFNPKSLLINSLLASPEVALNGNILKVSLREFEVPEKFKFPQGANVCTLTVGLSMVALHAGLNIDVPVKTMEITVEEHTVPASEFEFEVNEGCLCVVAIALKYFYLHEGIRTVYNSKAFHPAAVCGAIITPGTFIVPPHAIKIGNKTITTNWRIAGKIKLPAAE